jgi:hypothetical protein
MFQKPTRKGLPNLAETDECNIGRIYAAHGRPQLTASAFAKRKPSSNEHIRVIDE